MHKRGYAVQLRRPRNFAKHNAKVDLQVQGILWFLTAAGTGIACGNSQPGDLSQYMRDELMKQRNEALLKSFEQLLLA